MKIGDRKTLETDRKTAALSITGYSDKLSVKPGEEISIMISSQSPKYTASLVRLKGGITDFDRCEPSCEVLPAEFSGERSGRLQEIDSGSYAVLPLPDEWLNNDEFTVQMWIWPTVPQLGKIQTVWSARSKEGLSSVSLLLDADGWAAFSITDHTGKNVRVTSELPLEAKKWYFIAAQYSKKLEFAALWAVPKDTATIAETKSWVSSEQADLHFAADRFPSTILAAQERSDSFPRYDLHFNGKIDNPRFYDRSLNPSELKKLWDSKEETEPCAEADLVADYDFGKGISSGGSCLLVDRSPAGRHGTAFQGPTRAVTGHLWNGDHVDYRMAPAHYSAIHFHDDDLEDAGWEADIVWRVPGALASGIYAIRLEADGKNDYIPFFVRPASADSASSILFLAPTNTYLAYANERLFEVGLDSFMSHELKLADQDRYMIEHPEIGKSLYDNHTDGSGVVYSSRRRPILNLRPNYRNWLTGVVRHLAADLYITGWLEARGRSYDVFTDEDLHREGLPALEPYRVVVTGSHPEYWTRPMLKALKRYLNQGGRLMYLGANGFYWVTSIDDERPYLVEVRRGNCGTRCWDSPPGELHHSTTGEHGGLWRHHGFVPQELVGVGFTAQGWGSGCGYRRLEDSFRPEASFIFDGLTEDETIGNFGYVMGGAVGDEIDRFDWNLGTPKHAYRLATSTGLDDHYQFVQEDQLMTAPGQGGAENPLVRADLAYFELEKGGAVFSASSISWAGSMAWNDYDNNVARICDNVLDRFLVENKAAGGTRE